MPSTIRLCALLAGLAASLRAIAQEEPIDIKTDLEGQYFIVAKGGTADKPTLLVLRQGYIDGVLVKRAAQGYNHFILREFDCAAHSVRYLSEGESLEAMVAAEPESEMDAISQGSISDQLARHVCPKKEPAGE